MSHVQMQTSEVLARFGVSFHLVDRLVRLGRVRSPRIFAGRRVWTETEIEELRVALENRRPPGRPRRTPC